MRGYRWMLLIGMLGSACSQTLPVDLGGSPTTSPLPPDDGSMWVSARPGLGEVTLSFSRFEGRSYDVEYGVGNFDAVAADVASPLALALPAGVEHQFRVAEYVAGERVGQTRAVRATPYGDPLPSTPSFTASGGAGDVNFGVSVAGVPNRNVDAFDDVAVGASSGNSGTGLVRLYFGSATGLTSVGAQQSSGGGTDGYGSSVAPVPDINGDGLSEIAVGVWKFDNGQTDTGRILILPSEGASQAFSPATPSWSTGTSMATGRESTGKVLIAAGGDGTVTAGVVYSLSHAGSISCCFEDTFGSAMDEVGRSIAVINVDADAELEYVVGAPGAASGAGAVVSRRSFGGSQTWSPTTLVSGRFGEAITRLDFNGDTYPDLVITAPEAQGGEGRAVAYLGGSSGLAQTGTVLAAAGQQRFGIAANGIGDVNADGYDDLLIRSSTTVFLYSGGSTGFGTGPAWSAAHGEAATVLHGSSLGGADVNGDGCADALIGEPESGADGALHVFHGRPNSSGAVTVDPSLLVDTSPVQDPLYLGGLFGYTDPSMSSSATSICRVDWGDGGSIDVLSPCNAATLAATGRVLDRQQDREIHIRVGAGCRYVEAVYRLPARP